MDLTQIAQTAGATFTALTALAALLTVRHGWQEMRIARKTLEVETQPLVTDVPRGILVEPTLFGPRDHAALSLRAIGPEPTANIRVPIRNVGNGPARIREVVIVRTDGATAHGSVANPVLPPGEITHVGLSAEPDDPDWAVAASVAIESADFDLIVGYADASGHPREAVRLHVTNGQHPQVTDREWTRRSSDLRA
jgi:hypothetical protein